jgi:hypothetical protein
MTEDVPALHDIVAPPADGSFDTYHPANVAPLVVWLLSQSCPFSGRNFFAKGSEIREFLPWHYGRVLDNGSSRWTIADLDTRMRELA